MDEYFRGLLLLVVLLTIGCSADTVKQTTYETLQNVRQQECLKNSTLGCEKRDSYEDYLRKREALEPGSTF